MENQKMTDDERIRLASKDSEISRTEKIIIGILGIFACFLVVGFIVYVINVKKPQEASKEKLIASEYNNLIVTTVLPDEKDSKKNYIIKTDGSINTYYLASSFMDYGTVLSPDGKWIAYTKEHYENDAVQSEQSDIYIMQVNGSQPILISNRLKSSSPDWSPDGKFIAYQYQELYDWGGEIKYGMAITNIACILGQETCSSISTDLNLAGGFPAWSPDGKRIAYNDNAYLANDGSSSHIFVYDIYNHNPPVNLINTSKSVFLKPKWSPDGTKILTICSKEIKRKYQEKICVMNNDGSNLTELNTPSELNYITAPPEWSPDGLRIAFISSITNEGYANPGFCWDNCYYPKALFIMNNNGDNLTRLDLVDGKSIIWFKWYPFK